MPAADALPGPASCLAALAAGRDAVAWARLLADQGDRLRRCCARIAGEALADDAVQESLLVIRDHAGRFAPPSDGDPDAAARAWILAIAANSALQVLRRERRLHQREHRVASEAAMHQDHDPAAALIAAERQTMLRQALARLPPAMRCAVSLRHIEGLGSAEVAAALACPEGTAKALVHRGLERLRRLLGGRGAALGLAALAGMLAALPAPAGAGEAGLASGGGLLDTGRLPGTEPPPRQPPHPDRAQRLAAMLALAACLAGAALLAWPTQAVAAPTAPPPAAAAPAKAPAVQAAPATALPPELLRQLQAPQAVVGEATASTASTAITSELYDEQGRPTRYSLGHRGGRPWLEVRRDGAILWSGPVGSAEERALVPEELILGAGGLGLDFSAAGGVQAGGSRLQLRTGGQGAPPATPQ